MATAVRDPKMAGDIVDLDEVRDGFKLKKGEFLSLIDAEEEKMWARYEVALRFRERLYGGVPKDPKIVESWLAKKTGFSDEVTRAQVVQTLRERGVVGLTDDMTQEELQEHVKDMADLKASGFKFDNLSIYIEGRQVIAAIKESTNVLYAGERWGATKKGPKAYVTERVFIPSSKVRLYKPDGKTFFTEPEGIDLNMVHTFGPQGPVSAFTRNEYVDGAFAKFELKALRGHVEVDRFVRIFMHISENGIGASRSQGRGKLDVIKFDEIDLSADEEE